jgi:hypothetical protein
VPRAGVAEAPEPMLALPPPQAASSNEATSVAQRSIGRIPHALRLLPSLEG